MTTDHHINNLPPEILNEIQGYIHEEWLDFRLVCKNWSTIYCEYLYIKLLIYIEDYDISDLCGSNILFHHADELTIYNTPGDELEIMNNHQLFKNIKKLYLKGNVNLKIVDKFVSNPNSFIYNLTDLSIDTADKASNKKLNKIYKKGIKVAKNIHGIGLFNYLFYTKYKDKKFLNTALELNNMEAIKYMYKTCSNEDKLEWLEKGAQLGNLKFQLILGLRCLDYCEQVRGVEILEKVFNSLKHVEKNNKEIKFEEFSHYLGDHYWYGGDLKKALYYYLHANQKDTRIIKSIAGCYSQLNDYHKSYKWYKKLAKEKYNQYYSIHTLCNAELSIGWHHEFGMGVEQDYNAAFKSYLISSECETWASLKLSQFYCNGIGTSQNMEECIKYLIKSSNYTAYIIKFLNYFKLLNHLENLDEILQMIHKTYKEDEELTYENSDLTENEILQMVKPIWRCNSCHESLNGFYYSTPDDISLGVCMNCFYNEETLEELQNDLENRTLFKTHFLISYIPLLEYCKERNNINNQKLDNIIQMLKECKSP